MTYFRMPLLSHGTGPLAPDHMAKPLPGVASLSARTGRPGPGLSITPRHAGRPVAQMHAGAGSARGAHRGAALRAFWRALVNCKPCRLDCPYAPERVSAQFDILRLS